VAIILSKNKDEYFKVGTKNNVLGTVRRDIAVTELTPEPTDKQTEDAIKLKMDDLFSSQKRHCFIKLLDKDPIWAVLTCSNKITPKEDWWI